MAIVDFSTYTETDPSSEITVTPTKIDAVGLALDEIVHVTKDYGAGYFGDFVHRQKVHFESATDTGGNAGGCLAWSLVPAGQRTRQDIFDTTNGLMIEMARGVIYVINLRTFPGNNEDWYTIPSVPVDLWLEIERAGTTLTCKVYSDAYSTLIDTLSVSCSADTMRYHNAIAGMKTAADPDTITCYVESFDLVSGPAAIAKIKKSFNLFKKPINKMVSDMARNMG